jgi:hypothetical protein
MHGREMSWRLDEGMEAAGLSSWTEPGARGRLGWLAQRGAVGELVLIDSDPESDS